MFWLAAKQPPLTLSEQTRQGQRDAAAGRTITKYIRSQGLDADGLDVKFESVSNTLTVFGIANDKQTRSRILRCCRQIISVSRLVNRMQVQGMPGISWWSLIAQH